MKRYQNIGLSASPGAALAAAPPAPPPPPPLGTGPGPPRWHTHARPTALVVEAATVVLLDTGAGTRVVLDSGSKKAAQKPSPAWSAPRTSCWRCPRASSHRHSGAGLAVGAASVPAVGAVPDDGSRCARQSKAVGREHACAASSNGPSGQRCTRPRAQSQKSPCSQRASSSAPRISCCAGDGAAQAQRSAADGVVAGVLASSHWRESSLKRIKPSQCWTAWLAQSQYAPASHWPCSSLPRISCCGGPSLRPQSHDAAGGGADVGGAVGPGITVEPDVSCDAQSASLVHICCASSRCHGEPMKTKHFSTSRRPHAQ
ncbi:Phosphoserine aminotransferase [Frankliniella fusca]|uniref:Phosphoserine aminotransferase n=1 Tax=Frankliniella fusca TaxID=407009 RepID=A0AAE1HL53_9NEOP|nr:Phosphoserine aminotransferase [Frankliniella fusca]